MYKYFTKEFEGKEISFRYAVEADELDIKFDNNFAIANGYESADSLAKDLLEPSQYQEMIETFNGLPEWVRMMDDGYYVPVIDEVLQEDTPLTFPIVEGIAEA